MLRSPPNSRRSPPPRALIVATVEVSCSSAGNCRTSAMRRPFGDQASETMAVFSSPRESSRRPVPFRRIDQISRPVAYAKRRPSGAQLKLHPATSRRAPVPSGRTRQM